MNITSFKIPDISQHLEYIYPVQITAEMTLVFVFKTLFRSNNVLLDIYKDEITDFNSIITNVNLTANSMVCTPKPDLNVYCMIHCWDYDVIDTSLNKFNANNFYIQIQTEE